VKDENGDLLADSHNIVNRWKNYFSQLLNVHRVNDVRQIEIQTAEPLVPDQSPVEVEIAIAKLKRFKSPGMSIIVPVHKKGDKTDCSNYRGISLLSISYKIVFNILLSRLSPYIDDMTGDYQCGFRCNRSTTDQIFCIRQILEKK
jgi:hypothetical protein